MKMVKRWGVMTLVALLVLGTMGAALADDTVDAETEAETAKEPLEPYTYPALEWADGLVQFVFYWGYEDDELPAECPTADVGDSTGLFGLFGSTAVTGVGDAPNCLNVEKNGHVNHGSMVSSFVHWLKGDNLEILLRELDLEEANSDFVQELRDMPKGQLVKMFAQNEFGKGNFELPSADGPAAADVDAEESDSHGPPAWVMEKKAEKAAEKANKGENK
jgi:hypothetical protein